MPRGGREVPAPVPARARRRVPGHQPRAVRSWSRSWWRAGRSTAGGAVRGRRRRPVDLRVPRRDHPQHPRVRARLPERPHHPAGAELPLHPDHPGRRQRGDRPQPEPQAQAAVERRRAPASRSSATWPTPSTPRPTGSPGRSTGCADDGAARPGDVAVFYRTNAQSRVFEEVFIRLGLPYKVVGGVRFYERQEVRDALAYLRAVANQDDTVSLRRIINTPRRGIGDRAAGLRGGARRPGADLVRRGAARGPRRLPGISSRAANAIAEFVALLDELRELAAPPARRRCWRRRCSAPATSPRWRRASTRRTPAGWRTCRSWSAWPASTPSGWRQPDRSGGRRACPGDRGRVPGAGGAGGRRRRGAGRRRSRATGVVTLMTLHTAKGLEFPVVFLTGLEDGVFPHLRSLGDQPGAGGGAPAGVRGHHPGPAAALPHPRGHPVGAGGSRSTTRRRGSWRSCRSELVRWERTGEAATSWGGVGGRAGGPHRAARPRPSGPRGWPPSSGCPAPA